MSGTHLPTGWRRYSDDRLEELLDTLAPADDEYELVLDELDTRVAMRRDGRIAEMLGAPWLEPT